MSAWPLRKKTWSEDAAGAGAETTPREVPPLDLEQPTDVETATFALG